MSFTHSEYYKGGNIEGRVSIEFIFFYLKPHFLAYFDHEERKIFDISEEIDTVGDPFLCALFPRVDLPLVPEGSKRGVNLLNMSLYLQRLQYRVSADRKILEVKFKDQPFLPTVYRLPNFLSSLH